MSNPWYELFTRIGATMERAFAYWSMSNGAKFYLNIPKPEQVKVNTFSDDLEFPFTFSEILSLEFPKSFGKGTFELTNDLEQLVDLFPIPGLKREVQHDRIIVSADGT